MLLCLNKSKYNSLGIKAAFQSVLGSPPPIFNPLGSETKVAVLTAPVRSSVTTVISNYNGGVRPSPDELGYEVISAAADHSITVDQA
jgi:hypothetical protein